MIFLSELRNRLKEIYASYDIVIRPVIKFIFAFLVFWFIGSYIGYMERISSLPVMLVAALFCCVLPWGAPALFGAGFVLLDMMEVSIVFAGISFMLFLIIAVLYYGFRPGNGFLMAFIPLMFFIKIPFAVPLILGLCAGAASAVPAACGVFIWFLIKYFHNNAADMGTVLSLDNLTGNITGVLTGTLADRYMLLMIVAFALAIVTVSIIKGLSINHAWTVAVVSGAAVLLIVAVGGSVYFGISDNFLSDILGIVISTAAAFIYECMFFAVDYRGTEHVSFEDDDYYYYVKAVPKLKYSEDEERME